MAKMVEGALCGDAYYIGLHYWQWSAGTGLWRGRSRWWSHKEFEAQYDFLDEDGNPCEPPKPGECFWVELEL